MSYLIIFAIFSPLEVSYTIQVTVKVNGGILYRAGIEQGKEVREPSYRLPTTTIFLYGRKLSHIFNCLRIVQNFWKDCI